MDLASLLLSAGLIIMFYFVAPRWISKLLKAVAKESLGQAVLDIFAGRSMVDPETGEIHELEPHQAMYLFCAGLVQEAAATMTNTAMEEAAPFMASLHSEKITKEMQEKSAAARGFAKLPKGMQGRQAVQRTFHEVAKVVAPKPEGMAAQAMQWGQVAESLGIDVKGVLGGLGGQATPEAVVVPTNPTVGVP